MAITLNTLVYNQDSFVSNNKVLYTGPSHDFSNKDLLSLGRTAAKPTATFAGVARSETKRTKTVVLNSDSSTTGEAIVTVTTAFPVGMAEADADALVNDACDFGLSAGGNLLYWGHDINQ